MKSGTCVKCGSKDVLGGVRVIDEGYLATHPLRVETQSQPDALIFKGAHHAPLKAWVCGACGYTELYAEKPVTLSRKHHQGEGNR